jgi:hypothetical protein
MNLIYVADVGDGLSAALITLSGSVIQIDVGGSNSRIALDGLQRIVSQLGSPDALVLSHFHIDHYSGLLQASKTIASPFRIRQVFFPRIPEFADRRNFFQCLFAMNERVFGSETGIIEYDFLKAVSRLNKGRAFEWRSLCKGDNLNIAGSVFETLWPPRTIDEKKTLGLIKRAISDFNRAMEEDEETRQLYKRLQGDNAFEVYLEEEEGIEGEKEPQRGENQLITHEPKRLPEVVRRANQSLYRAANHLSLAMFEDNRFLFLGDTEGYEIARIVNDLEAKDRRFFLVLITPHHGTHWHKSLRQIVYFNSITSNGMKLCSRMREEIKMLSNTSLATFANGDIILPGQNMQCLKTIIA